MKNDVIEANVVMAKCKNSHKTYGIRVEKRRDNAWYFTWAFKMDEKVASNEGYEKTKVSGLVYADEEYPGCPDCGGKGWISCGGCRKLTCYDGESTYFTCPWCKTSGKLQTSDTFDLNVGSY